MLYERQLVVAALVTVLCIIILWDKYIVRTTTRDIDELLAKTDDHLHTEEDDIWPGQ